MKTKENIITWLKAVDPENAKHRQAVTRALLFMFSRQTTSEQSSHSTNQTNGRGFNGIDAAFLSSVAESSKRYGSITPKQCKHVAKALVKYAGQLTELSAMNQTPQTVPETVSETDQTRAVAAVSGVSGV